MTFSTSLHTHSFIAHYFRVCVGYVTFGTPTMVRRAALREASVSRHHVGPTEGLLSETPLASWHYVTEELKGGPEFNEILMQKIAVMFYVVIFSKVMTISLLSGGDMHG